MLESQLQPTTSVQGPLNSRQSLVVAAVLVVTFLGYAPTLTFGWVYDDVLQVPNNADLLWSRIGFLLTHHLWASNTMAEARFYRPLLSVWFLLNKSLFGLSPHWFHLTTVLAHLAATALAFVIARKLLRNFAGAILAAAIFGLHPLHTEAAAWISDVDDSLVAILLFSSLLAYLKAAESQRALRLWLLSGLFFALALLTKESAIVCPAVIIAHWFSTATCARRTLLKRGSAMLAGYGSIVLGYLFLRSWVVGDWTHAAPGVTWALSLLAAPYVTVFYLLKLIAPFNLSPHYDPRFATAALSLRFAVPVLLLTGLAYAAWRARRNRDILLALAWIVIPLIPALNIRWLNAGDPLHDRYAYVSVLGVGLLAGVLWQVARRRWPQIAAARAISLAVLLTLAFTSAIQSQNWANDAILFLRAVRIAPDNAWAHYNYACARNAQRRFREASGEFTRSYELAPGWRAAQGAGLSYQQLGDYEQSERWYRRALELNPALPEACFGLGQIRLGQQRPEEALFYIRRALDLHPAADDGYRYALGMALERTGKPQLALASYEDELRLHPQQVAAQKAIDRLQRLQ